MRGGRGLGRAASIKTCGDECHSCLFVPATTTKLKLRSPLHHAPHGPPPPLRGGGCTRSFSRRIARECCQTAMSNIRSPHERSDMRVRSRSFNVHPGCRFAHPGYEEIREAERRQTHCRQSRTKRRAVAPRKERLAPPFRSRARSPAGVPPRLLPRGLIVTQGATQAMLPGTRVWSGRYPPSPVPVQ